MPLNFSFTHLMVVGIVALVVLGPERLPGVARTAGNLYREWKRISTGLEAEVREVFSEFSEPFNEVRSNLSDSAADVRTAFTDTAQAARSALNGNAPSTAVDDQPPGQAPSLGRPLGPSTGLVSPGPTRDFALPELAPPPDPSTFVPFTPGPATGTAGGNGA